MNPLTQTQVRVLAALSSAWQSPKAIAGAATDGNAGGAARSLRDLVSKGLVEKRQRGKAGRWTLYEYRLPPGGVGTDG